jgi:SAM-dependent methyltransferase
MYLDTLNGKLFLAPLLPDALHILDLGTGTGMWALDFADRHPNAVVYGVDISLIQPKFVPPNCQFQIDDFTLDWTWKKNFFDFVHARGLSGCLPDDGMDTFGSNLWKCTKPGGYVEVVELDPQIYCDDGELAPGDFYVQWAAKWIELGKKTGKSFNLWREIEVFLGKAGFVDIEHKDYKWAMNEWPGDQKMKRIGVFNRSRLEIGAEGLMLRLLTGAGNVS